MTDSRMSLRSMELLTPEPPRELNIPVVDSEEDVRSGGDSRRSKKGPRSKKRSPKATSEVDEERINRGIAKIQSNDMTLFGLKVRHLEIREETAAIRRENAESFYKLRHLLGKKGHSFLKDLYFNDYPHLAQLDAPHPHPSVEDNSEVKSAVDLSQDQSEISFDEVGDRIFYQTEVLEGGSVVEKGSARSFGSIKDDGVLDDEDLANLMTKYEKKTDFIQRNKELAATGDILTKVERERFEALMAIDDDDDEESNDHEVRLAQINTELENKYSFTSLVPIELEADATTKRLQEIESRLSIIQGSRTFRTPSSNLLSITEDDLPGPQSSILDVSKLLSEFQLELESDLGDDRENQNFSISESQVQDLIASARTELDQQLKSQRPRESH